MNEECSLQHLVFPSLSLQSLPTTKENKEIHEDFCGSRSCRQSVKYEFPNFPREHNVYSKEGSNAFEDDDGDQKYISKMMKNRRQTEHSIQHIGNEIKRIEKVYEISNFIKDKEDRKEQHYLRKVDSETLQKIHIATMIKLIRKYPEYLRDISDFEFIEQIGQGGFSKVWKAQDLRTGHICAVKELHEVNLTGRLLLSYVREIHTTIASQSRFVIPFIGFTITPPYCIITEYMPFDTLFNYTNISHRRTRLSGTHLTVIAMCIAKGMSVLEDRKVLHRDLKALNILIDKEGLPKICDFGVSRFANENGRLSKKIGTLSHMAPELLNSREYNSKVDVYSFGMLLYEMIESHNCYSHQKPQDIERCIQNNIMPRFKNANRNMRKLIKRCWSKNPIDRPTFEEIFSTFKSGKAYFPGSNISEINEFIKMIEEEEHKSAPNPKKEIFCNIDEIISDLETRFQIQEVMNKSCEEGRLRTYFSIVGLDHHFGPPGSNFSVIENNHNFSISSIQDSKEESFYKTLEYLQPIIQPNEFSDIFKYTLEHFHKCDDIKAMNAILEFYREISKRNHNFLNIFHEYKLFTILPFEIKELTENIYQLLFIFYEQRPNLIDQSYRRITQYYIIFYPLRSILLFGKFIEQVSLTKDPYPVIKFFLSYARRYLHHKTGCQYINILYNIILKYQEYHEFAEFNKDHIRPIFCKFLSSKIKEVCIESMKAICSLYDQEFKIPINILNHMLKYDECSRYSVSILLRIENIPASEELFSNLVTRSLLTFRTFNLVLKFISQSREHCKVASENLLWMKILKPETIEYSLQIFLYLFSDHEFKSKLITTDLIFNFLNYLTFFNEIKHFTSIYIILKSIQMDQEFCNKLVSTGFIKNYLSLLIQNRSKTTDNQFIFTVEPIIRKVYCDDYVICLPRILELIQNTNEPNTNAISLISTLSRYPEVASKLAIGELIFYFKKLCKIPQMRRSCEFFLKNVESYYS